MNILEAEVREASKSNLYTAKIVAARYPLIGIRNNLYKNSMTMFMSEVLYRVIKDGALEPGLYEWAEKNILLLDALDTDFSNFHIRFLLELTVVLGFSPESHDLMPFVGENFALVSRFMSEPFAESMLIKLNGALRNEIAEDILRYIEYDIEASVNVNSLRVLRELFI